MDKYSILFAGNDLSAISGLEIENHDFNQLPERDIRINKLARRDKSIITSADYVSKEIPVYFYACGGSRAGTEDVITQLKSLTQAQNALLVISQGGDTVEYIATMNEMNIEWIGTSAQLVLNFLASDPVGKNSVAVDFIPTATITSASGSYASIVLGSATVYPTFSLTVTAVTGGTGASITILNALTSQGITITRDWTAGELVEINSEDMKATVDGDVVDFTGMFPQFTSGTQQIQYLDTFTTRNITLSAVYNPRLL